MPKRPGRVGSDSGMNDEIKRFPEALRYVGKLIYERGWDYYRSNKILSFVFSGNTISARVQGAAAEEYGVTVEMENNTVVSSACTCPYWARCKHIAAVVIYYFDNGASIVRETGLQERPVESFPERTIHLNFTVKQNDRVKHFLRKINDLTQKEESGDQRSYALVFRLKKKALSYYSYGWFVSPALRLVKKNGLPGSVYGYSPEKKLVTHSAYEEALLRKLKSVQDKSESIDHHLQDIIEHPEIELYVLHDYRYVPVSRRPLSLVRVRFELARIERDTPVFKLNLQMVSDGNGEPVTVPTDSLSVVRYGDYLAVLVEEGYIYYCIDDEVLNAFLTGLAEIGEYSAGDARLVKEFVEKQGHGKIEVAFTTRSVTVKNPLPAKIIEVERRFLGALVLELVFDYEGNEVRMGGPDTIVSNNSEEDTIVVLRRNSEAERAAFDVLTGYFNDIHSTGYSFLERKSTSFVIGQDLDTFLSGYGLELMDSGFTLRIGKEKKLSGKTGKLGLRIKTGIDWFDVSLAYLDDAGNELQVSIDPHDAFKGLVKTADSYVLLAREDIAKMRELLALGMGQSGNMKISRYNLEFIDEFYESFVNKGENEIVRIKELYERLANAGGIDEYPLPESFGGTLREYQRAGYNWLHFLRKASLGGCLADDMGLGKTVQTLALLEKLKESGELGLVLLVVPVTTFVNWETEIDRFCPGVSHLRHAGQLRSRNADDIKRADIVIVSYQTLRNDHAIFSGIEFDYLILDEAQSIKNAYTKAYKVIRSLRARHKLTLTGTPVENSSIELWAMMEILNPGLLRSIDDFKRRFARPIQESSGGDASAKLRRIVSPFILRRKKEDVLRELPEKEIIDLRVELGESQRHAYDEVRNAYREKISSKMTSDGIRKSRMLVLEGLLRLRQMTLFPSLASGQYAKVESAKFELLKEMIEDILSEDHKILVYSQFVQVLKIIEEHVKTLSTGYAYLDGSTRGRSRAIDTFQKNDETRIFLLSLKAGGLGINLTKADYVILFDPWWNPAIEAQAIGRAHRIGQVKKVICYKFIAKDTIEEKILALQEKKRKLVRDIITEDSSVFKNLDAEEIMSLFG